MGGNAATTSIEAGLVGNIYLYGIMDGEDGTQVADAGVDGSNPVYTVARNGLACVVGDYKGGAFAALPREQLLRCLLAHQRVLERVMLRHAVLPVKFGTLLADVGEVHGLLAQRQWELRNAIASVRDSVEIEVAATWDTSLLLQEISREEQVVRAREAIILKGPPTQADQVRLGQAVKACMDKRRESYRERMLALLKPLAIDVATNALISDKMVMNIAFLIQRASQGEFEERVKELDSIFEDQITFRLIGPLPPYSFSTVAVTRLAPEQIERAQQILQIGHPISPTTVRRAYRRLAAEMQRNLQPGDEIDRARFTMLREASELLLGYCQSQKEARGDEGGNGSTSQGRDCPFLISISRFGGDEVWPARWSGSERV